MDLLELFPGPLHLPAFQGKEDTLSYAELFTRAKRLASSFREKGIVSSCRAAFLGYPNLSSLLIFLSLIHLQVVLCPVNFRLPPLAQKQALGDLKAHFFISPSYEVEHLSPSSTFTDSRLFSLLTTSGSQSRPKIACHTLDNYLYSTAGLQAILPWDEKSRVLLSLPLYHVAGLTALFRALQRRATLVARDDSWESLSFTHASLVPTQLHQLLETKTSPEKKMLLIGGAPLSSSLAQEARKRGWQLHTSYGMTEMTATIAIDGKLLPFREATLSAEGEIWVRGKTLFLGYLGKNNIDLPLNHLGWFPSGDLGSFHDCALHIIGRRDNLFISGGENIQCEEIEEVLLSLPGIIQALVVPVPDPLLGMRPVAFIAGDFPAPLNQLSSALSLLLPPYKIPIAYFSLSSHRLLYRNNWTRENDSCESRADSTGYFGIKPNRRELCERATQLMALS